MSSSDLRPGGGHTKSGRGTDFSFSRIRLPMFVRTKVGALITILLVGFLAGVIVSTIQGAWNGKIAPGESNITKLQAAIKPSLEAFYSTPNTETQTRAISVITNYRLSFADALKDTLQQQSEKLVCAEGGECRVLRADQQKRYMEIEKAIFEKIPPSPRTGVAFNTDYTAAKTLERRLPIQNAVNDIERFRKRFDANLAAEGIRQRLFADMDAAMVDGKIPDTARGWPDRFRDHTVKASDSFKRFEFFRVTCAQGDAQKAYEEACYKAVKEYQIRIRELDDEESRRMRGTLKDGAPIKLARDRGRAIAVQKLIVDRDAPIQFIEREIVEVFRLR